MPSYLTFSHRLPLTYKSVALRAFSTNTTYDVAVIGGGPGGYVAAIKSAQLGLKTVCIESRGKLGGTCLNVGCIPSKALLHATHLYSHAKHSYDKYGIDIKGIDVNFEKLMGSKTKAVEALTGGIEHLFKKNKVDYVKGYGKLSGKTQINVTATGQPGSSNTVLNAKHILLATGSVPTSLPGIDVNNEEGVLVDSTGALSLKKIPKHLIVIGGGVIGLELGSVYNRLGSQVTVVEYAKRICPAMDTDLVREFTKILKKQGLKFLMEKKVVGYEKTANGVELSIESVGKSEKTKIEGDVVLVATGRRPFTANLGLQELGIVQDKQGRIEVDHCFRTNIPNIFSFGDCIKGPMLAHKAEEEGIACVEYIAKQMEPHVNYDAIPGVVYTSPEVASVGKTEEQLKEAKIPYNIGKFPMLANSRARSIGEDEGYVKVLACKSTDRILGIHIINASAGEMIAEGTLGIEYGASSEDIGRTCHAHPTLSEAFKEACNAAYDKPINF